jgi:hypothetical protein
MAIRIGQIEITFSPYEAVLRTVWMKALFQLPETVNIRKVKNQPPPSDTNIAVFEVQNRIPAFRALLHLDPLDGLVGEVVVEFVIRVADLRFDRLHSFGWRSASTGWCPPMKP